MNRSISFWACVWHNAAIGAKQCSPFCDEVLNSAIVTLGQLHSTSSTTLTAAAAAATVAALCHFI